MLYSAENGAKELCQAFSKLAARSSITYYYLCSEHVRKIFQPSSQAARDTTHRLFTLWVCLIHITLTVSKSNCVKIWYIALLRVCARIIVAVIPLGAPSHSRWSVRVTHSLTHFSPQSCLTLCDPMNRSTPGLPVHHQLPESTQTHVHWVSDAIQPSHPPSSPSPPALNLSQHQGLFKWVSSSHQVAKVLEFQLQHQSLQWTPRTDLL